jgi:hypothetical protein
MQYLPRKIIYLGNIRAMLTERCCIAKRLKGNEFRADPGAEWRLSGHLHRERAQI